VSTRECQSDSSSLSLGRSDDWINQLLSINVPRPDGSLSRVRDYEVVSNYEQNSLTLDTVFPCQKSSCALILTNRGVMTNCGAR
jgi:hypothetical protein